MIEQVEKFKAELNTGSFCDQFFSNSAKSKLLMPSLRRLPSTRASLPNPNRECGEAVHVKPLIQSAVQLRQREMATASKSRHLPKTQTSDRTG
jgi:hypothetical protein